MFLMRYSVLAKWSKLLFPWCAVELVCTRLQYFMILCGQNYTGISLSLSTRCINRPISQVQTCGFCVMYTHAHTHNKSSQHVYGSTWINRQPASGHQESIPQHTARTQVKNKAAPQISYTDTHAHTTAMTREWLL